MPVDTRSDFRSFTCPPTVLNIPVEELFTMQLKTRNIVSRTDPIFCESKTTKIQRNVTKG